MAVDFLAAGLAVLVVLAVFLALLVPNLTPASLASLDAAALRREAVFFLMRPFLAALSYSDWREDKFSAEGFVRKF